MSEPTRQAMAVDLMNAGTADNFRAKVFSLLWKADPTNKAKMRIAWPEEVAFYEEYMARLDGPDWLARLALEEAEIGDRK